MGWAEEVHESRMQASLAQARKEYRLQKRGYPVPVQPDARLPSLFSLAAAGAALVWWRKEGRRLRGRDWRQLPLIKQLHELIMHGQVLPSASTVRGRQQKPPPPRPAKPSRAQQVARQASNAAASSSAGSGSSTPAAGALPDPWLEGLPTASGSNAGSGGGKKPKKKQGGGKKKR